MHRREEKAVQERAEALIALSSEQGFPFHSAVGTIYRGWALVEQGQEEEGIAQMRQGLAAHRTIETELARPYFLALLAGAYGKVGQTEEGVSALAEELTLVNKTGERFYEAELYRLAGELSLRMGERETGRKGEEKVAHSPTLPFAPTDGMRTHSSENRYIYTLIAKTSLAGYGHRECSPPAPLPTVCGKRESPRATRSCERYACPRTMNEASA